jgi:hypothetical protein
MRCPDCNKFVSYDDQTEPEVELEVDEDGNVSGTAHIILTCADCGTELKTADFDVEASLEIPEGHKGEGHELEIELDGAELTVDRQTTDRHGKPIKNPRYMKTLYGYSAEFTVRCSCQETDADDLATGSASENISASSMDEQV